jgi:hypothetical protein
MASLAQRCHLNLCLRGRRKPLQRCGANWLNHPPEDVIVGQDLWAMFGAGNAAFQHTMQEQARGLRLERGLSGRARR